MDRWAKGPNYPGPDCLGPKCLGPKCLGPKLPRTNFIVGLYLLIAQEDQIK